jgi:hypothetical protein
LPCRADKIVYVGAACAYHYDFLWARGQGGDIFFGKIDRRSRVASAFNWILQKHSAYNGLDVASFLYAAGKIKPLPAGKNYQVKGVANPQEF